MIALVQSLKVYLCTQNTDMRRSFDGLCGMAASVMRQDPLSGHLFVFRNRTKDCIKILYWDQDGLAIWYKNQKSEATHFNIFTEVGIGRTFKGIVDETRSTCF